MSKIYVGDTGTIFDLDTDPDGANAVDLTGYTLTILFRRPSGAVVTMAAALKPGSFSVVRYTTVAGDICESGTWSVQVRAVLAAQSWLGETASFVVYAAFN